MEAPLRAGSLPCRSPCRSPPLRNPFGTLEVPRAAHCLEVPAQAKLRERPVVPGADEPEMPGLLAADDDRVRIAREHGGGQEVDRLRVRVGCIEARVRGTARDVAAPDG